jgi:hypothetical protein
MCRTMFEQLIVNVRAGVGELWSGYRCRILLSAHYELGSRCYVRSGLGGVMSVQVHTAGVM